MILGAGRGQVGLIKAAQAMGVRAIVATMPSDTAPGISMADEVVYVDIADPAGVLEAARGLRLDGIATSCADTGLLALGTVCDALGLPGISEATASCCSDKAVMKRAFMDAGVRTARYALCANQADAESAVESFGFPAVVKALDLQGSQGVVIVERYDDLADAFTHAKGLSGRNQVLVEEFIEGVEFGVQALVFNGEPVFILPHDDGLVMARTAVPVRHSVPMEAAPELLQTIEAEVRRVVSSLSLDNCAVNVDLILCGEDVYVIEATGRVGANGLGELVSKYFDINYYEAVLKVALGMDIDKNQLSMEGEHPSVVANMLFPNEGEHGVIDRVFVDDLPRGAEVVLFRPVGARVDGFSSSADCLGQIVAVGDTLADAERVLIEAKAKVAIHIEEDATE